MIFFDKKTLILIGGPTASGKSRIAVELSAALEAEIINADSVQLYKDLPILTANVTEESKYGIPHHLYSVLEFEQTSSVEYWLKLLENKLNSLNQTNSFVVVGGTGFFLSALMYGLSPIPEISDNLRYQIRQQSRSIVNSSGVEALYNCVVKKDPLISGKIHPHNTQRIIRAWEVWEQTGRSIVVWQKEPRKKNIFPKSPLFIIDVPRATLHQRIEKRCKEMVNNGVIDEVKEFAERTEGKYSTLHKAIGFAEIKKYLDGETNLDEAISSFIQETKQYSKRQQTWFNTQYTASDVCLISHDNPSNQASLILKNLYSLKI